MPIILSGVDAPLKTSDKDIIEIATKELHLKSSQIKKASIHKTSFDARKQNNIKIVSSVYFELFSKADENEILKKNTRTASVDTSKLIPVFGNKKLNTPIIIAGFGPAGMFAALTLAEYGYCPIVLERGEEIDKRIARVNDFWQNGNLSSECNVQFGEGGAGTFSDGKLTTRIKDPLCTHILKKFIKFGAPEEIMTKAKPHIGTDKLRDIVKNIRSRITELGGTVIFSSAVKDIIISQNAVTEIVTDNASYKTENFILAIGHSARDTFEMLLNKGVFIEPKPFSVGARIEHTQDSVNQSLYGKYADNEYLPQGEYQLSYRENERGVYTFCMCPGGLVVPSASEEETVVTNGMSEYARDKKNANAALVVSVSPEDFGKNPLDGVTFARKIEKSAYLLGGKNYKAPAVSVGNFLTKKNGISDNAVIPSYSLGVTPADFDTLFPLFVTDMMRKGLINFSKKMKCFGDENAILTGAETRTSSPVRISRNENFMSVTIKNLYPCGEGAGYAGGIMSAAVDGVKIALKIIEKYKPVK